MPLLNMPTGFRDFRAALVLVLLALGALEKNLFLILAAVLWGCGCCSS
jgi:hypothetical protein